MLEDFLDALQNFRRNKTRTFLSLLGVIIGVASVIIITSMGSVSAKQIKDTFGSSGLDVVSVSTGFMRKKRDAVTITFDESFRENLFERLENIKKIWYKNSLGATISYETTSSTVSCNAVEAGYLEMYGLQLEKGRYISITDDYEGNQKIILGSTIAEALFPDGDGIGKYVVLTASKISFNFQVVGILKEQNSGMEFSTNAAYIPRGFYSKKIKPNPSAETMMVQAVSAEKAPALVEKIENYCQTLTGTSYSVNVTSMQTMIEQMNSITKTLSLMLSAIAAISLFVGGIGIMNIMIVTVTERKQEIGIRKALGATPADIRRQFLVESASITLIGGLLGIFIGIAVSLAIEYVKNTGFSISPNACIVSFAFSVAIGIFFGLNPAARAAKLDPVVALAGE